METDHVHDEYCAVDVVYCATSQVHEYGYAVINRDGTTVVIDYRTSPVINPGSTQHEDQNPTAVSGADEPR